MKDKQQVILEAVRRAKKSEFGVTAIKVELEANLDRNWELEECHDYMMEHMPSGLAEKDEDREHYLSQDDYSTPWQPTGALKYAETYNDGSVDTEFTFTILLDKPENINYLPRIVDIWNDMCEAAGEYVDVEGAGMHMAFLNEPRGNYPSSNRDEDYRRFDNFQRSMPLLLPALFFLGASNNESRGTDYRRPEITHNSHRGAIDWRNGALEFRVFDTCYDKPSQILDNFVVMTKCLRYWKTKLVPHGMDKVTDRTSFGNNYGHDLDRFYVTHTHLDLLNRGLARLKPSYYTIKDIKRQRGFAKTKTTLKKERKDYTKRAEVEYKEYEERFKWHLKMVKARYLADQYEQISRRPYDVPEEELEQKAEARMREENTARRSPGQYIQDRLREYEQNLQGSHTLRA